MTRIRTLALPIAVLCTVVAVTGCKKKEEPAAVPTTTTPPATEPAAPAPLPPVAAPVAEVVSIDLGSAVGADQRVTTPKTTFAPKDRIVASVATRAPDPGTGMPSKLAARWSHVDSNQTVNEEARDIALQGDKAYSFEITNPQPWPTGKYRVEVMLDGKTVQTRDFEVK